MDEIQHHVNELEACCKSDVFVNELIVHLQLPRMVLLLRKAAKGGGVAATSYCFVPVGHDQRTEPVWRLCDRPLETFAVHTPVTGLCRNLWIRGTVWVNCG